MPCLRGETCSIETVARVRKEPRPVRYASRMPSSPTIRPPEGRSGPGMSFMSSSRVASGFRTRWRAPAATSRMLCGAMLVAMPTAMPVAPLTSRLGYAAGSTAGCWNWLS